MTYKRLLNPTKSKSYFLFGPRQTGKSTFVKMAKGEEDLYLDLLPQQTGRKIDIVKNISYEEYQLRLLNLYPLY